jgi:phenylacetate-coenzyme A ligase PaaK-like adenylate-forming protein
LIAAEWPDRTLRAREDLVLVETRARPDQRFDILLTLLGNSSFPLLRYEIEDVTDGPLERGPESFAILQNVAGRNDDLLLTKDGGCLHPTRIDAVFEDDFHSSVRRYRLHQHTNGSVSVYVEPGDTRMTMRKNHLGGRLERILGYPVRVNIVDEVPSSPAGKLRMISSDMAAIQAMARCI